MGLSVWLRLLDFRGRSTRTEVFYFFVVTALLGVAAALLLTFIGAFDLDGALQGIVPNQALRTQLSGGIGFLPVLPVFALVARRLHDIGLPGWPALPLVLTGLALALWNDLHFRAGETVAALPGALQLPRVACGIAIYAILLWAPQRRANRYGPDPRIFRESESATESA